MNEKPIKKINIKTFADRRGKLSVLEIGNQLNFNIKRIYYLYELKKFLTRGQHAHKDLKQCIICLNGAIEISLDTGKKKTKHYLSKPNQAILLSGAIWREIDYKKKNSIVLVLASKKYNKNDYIKNKTEFKKFVEKKKNIKIQYINLEKCHESLQLKFLDACEKLIKKNDYILGKEVHNFEENFAKFSKAKYAVSCGNGFDALILALKALKINSRDEVLLPANSFTATAMAVSNVGAKPIFVDCNENDYSINLEDLKKKITKKTKVIIPVSLYGIPIDFIKINKIAKKYNLNVIEDASQSHGASFFSNNQFNYKKYPNWKFSTFSFYPTKNLGALGDGGALLTDDKNLSLKVKSLRNYGLTKKYDHKIIGINSRLDEIQARFLNIKLKYLKKWTLKKRRLAGIYFKELKDIQNIKMLNSNIVNKSVFHIFPLRILNNRRDEFINFLKKNNIETNIHYPISINNQSAYKKLKYKTKNCDNIQNEIVSLPIDPYHKLNEILYVCKIIKKFFNKN